MKSKPTTTFTTNVSGSAQVDTINQANTINIYERSFAQKLTDKLEQIFHDLPQVFDDFPTPDKINFRKTLASIESIRNQPDAVQWLEDQFKQMTNTYSEEDAERILDKLKKLVQFLLLLQSAGCTYTLVREGEGGNWTKITGTKAERQRKFELFDSSNMLDLSIKVLGPRVLMFLLDKDFPLGVEDVVLICRKPTGCKEECLQKEGLFPAIVQDFTDVEYYRSTRPTFFDQGLKGQICITCGSCLVDITEYARGQDILERMFSS